MLSASVYEKYRFIKEHCGYIVGESAIGALRTAKAAQAAEAMGFTVSWDYDDCFRIGNQGDFISDEAFQRGLNSGRYEVLVARVEDYQGHTLASLGGIIVDWRDRDSAEDYKESIELELLAEAWEAVKKDH